jgi:hypothetical protein
MLIDNSELRGVCEEISLMNLLNLVCVIVSSHHLCQILSEFLALSKNKFSMETNIAYKQ